MARIARLVVPGFPHHVTQRGNRRQKTFFSADDYRTYIKLVGVAKTTAGVAIWAYCLMPNHVHLIAVPKRESSLAQLFASAHLRYTRYINSRNNWRGHLWQERFHSCVMDQQHLISAARYVELNPVRAGLCTKPEDWRWSSARAHLSARDDRLVHAGPLLKLVSDWRRYLQDLPADHTDKKLREHSRSGRPLGDQAFVKTLESITGRRLRRQKPGRRRMHPDSPDA